MGRKFLLLGTFAALIFLLAVAILILFSPQKKTQKISNATPPIEEGENPPPASQTGVSLVEKWINMAGEDSGEFSVQFIDLTDNQKLGYEENKIYQGASVNKLVTAGYLLSQFDKGKLDLRKDLGDKTLQEHAKLMINQSNNDSWQALNDELGYTNIENFAKGLGMSNFEIENNEVTAKDMGVFLEKLYKGQVLTEASKQLLYSWMRGTETEDRVTLGLPSNTTFYHKTGTFEKALHDAAIIIHPKKPFVLVVFTNGVKDGRTTITQITRDAWAYVESKP